MSGHSKWATIHRKKGELDAQRGKIFQKIAKEIYVAARGTNGNPDDNPNLRAVLEKAKSNNMPKDNIQKAIDKAVGNGADENYESVRYEGYGPGGVAIMLDCLTDNRNRTAMLVRSTLTKRNGNLGTDGSVSYMFKRKGLIVLENEYPEEKVMEDILGLDIIDMEIEDEEITIYTEPEKFLNVKDELDKLGYDKYLVSEVTFVPDNYITLDEEGQEKVMTLVEALEDLDDVQNVYHNLDI